MAVYRYYFLDTADHVISTGLIDCDTDDQAQANAHRMLAGSDHAAIEVWDGSRQVHYENRTSLRGS